MVSQPNRSEQHPRKNAGQASQVREERADTGRRQSRLKAVLKDPFVVSTGVLGLAFLMGIAAQDHVELAQRSLDQYLLRADGGQDFVTSLAWSQKEDGPLWVGTQSGRVLKVGRNGRLEQEFSRSGPILRVFPAPDGGAELTAVATSAEPPAPPVLYELGSRPLQASAAAANEAGMVATTSAPLTNAAAAQGQALTAQQTIPPYGEISIWDASSNTPRSVATMSMGGQVTRLAILASLPGEPESQTSAIRSILLSGSTTGGIVAFDLVKNAGISEGAPHRGEVVALATAANPDAEGAVFASVGADGSYYLWRWSEGSFSPQNVPFTSPTIRNQVAPEPLRVSPPEPSDRSQALLSPETLKLSANGHTLMLQDGAGEVHLAMLAYQEGSPTFSPTIVRLAPRLRGVQADLSADGRQVILASPDHLIRVWSISEPEAPGGTSSAELDFEIHGHGDVVNSLAMSPDGAYLASASVDGRLRLTHLSRAKDLSDGSFTHLWLGERTPKMEAKKPEMRPPATEPLLEDTPPQSKDDAPPPDATSEGPPSEQALDSKEAEAAASADEAPPPAKDPKAAAQPQQTKGGPRLRPAAPPPTAD